MLERNAVGREIHMWVFGYGSLMWDGWESEYFGRKCDRAVLPNFRRSFNKKSVENWGTPERPGPTLGLEEDPTATCVGTAFEFDEKCRNFILLRLRKREGKSFLLKELGVVLPDDRHVWAVKAVNDKKAQTYIGSLPLRARASMVRIAVGTDGSCLDYVTNIRAKLNELNIYDQNIEEFYKHVMDNDEMHQRERERGLGVIIISLFSCSKIF